MVRLAFLVCFKIPLTNCNLSAYPIEYIENTLIPCVSDGHPTNIVLLTCDARGVLPPISKLTTEQTMFHFISGYTSKMAGTEDGVTEPQATFSSCFAQPFLALHPMRYAKMLAEKIQDHKVDAWLLNTGWVGAGAATGGKRCPLKYTRAILDAIHSGELAKAEYETYETFNLQVPTSCPNVPDDLLNPAKGWTGSADFKEEVTKLVSLFDSILIIFERLIVFLRVNFSWRTSKSTRMRLLRRSRMLAPKFKPLRKRNNVNFKFL